MLDPVFDGAYVDVRYGSPVTKVHRNTCGGAKTLQKENKTMLLCSIMFDIVFHNIYKNEVRWSIMSPHLCYISDSFSKIAHTKEKACNLQASPCHTKTTAADGLREVSTSSRKTKKVTFFSSVATSVPSLVKSWRPLGAWLGHFCRLGLYFNSVSSVQLFDRALRYLEFIKPRKRRKRQTGTTL